jgi:hypothetical protein
MSFQTLEVSVSINTTNNASAGEIASDSCDAPEFATEPELEILLNMLDLAATEKGTRSMIATVYMSAVMRQASYTQSSEEEWPGLVADGKETKYV